LVEKLPSSGKNTFENYLTTPIKNTIFCYPTDKYEISIRKLKDNKSPGPDNIGPKLVKCIKYAIVDPLEYIFNISIHSGKVPTKMKTAKIIPVFKKGKNDLMSNYRPMSLLSIFDKLLEKIVHTRLYSFLSSNNILYEYQFGCRKISLIRFSFN